MHRPTDLPDDLLRALPKTDLHVHLDGSLRLPTLIDLAEKRGVPLPSTSVSGMSELVFKDRYDSLGEYLQGFAYTCAVLQDPEALERAAYELAWDNINEGVRYIEVRFAPQLHMSDSMGFDAVLTAVNRGMARAQVEENGSQGVRDGRDPPFRYGIIVCAMRMFTGAFSAWYDRLCQVLDQAPRSQIFGMASLELARAAVSCRDRLGIPIVGFDLAGQEDGYPAHDHVDAYDYCHQHFLMRTVHAGEAYGPESIYDAITRLHAERIGHGYHLFSPELCGPAVGDPDAYVEALAEYIADRRITIEVCITSNLQTNPTIGCVADHALHYMVDKKLSATICTDNRLVSHTTVTDELRLAVDAFKLTPDQLRHTIIHGFKRSFFAGTYLDKRVYVRQVIDAVDRVFRAHGFAT
ncbi:MAG: adenosine deaminase family protein [Oligoflexia bacterium]|nr:adenosine deaminase family protein [Oligoflexia bacterium]